MFFFKASESKGSFLVLFFFSKIVVPGNSFIANFLTTAFCFLGLLGSTLETRCTAFPSDALDLNAGLVTTELEII